MKAVCPHCGGPVNAQTRGMSLHSPERDRPGKWPSVVYHCVTPGCRLATFEPAYAYEHRIDEWGQRFLRPALMVFGMGCVLAFVLQFLGIL